jgi:hypothetical protein
MRKPQILYLSSSCDEDDDCDDPQNLNTEPVETDFTRDSYRPTRAYLVPRGTARAASCQKPTTRRPTQMPDDVDDDNNKLGLCPPPNMASRIIKRRCRSTRNQRQRKIQKGNAKDSTDNLNASSSPCNRALRSKTGVDGDSVPDVPASTEEVPAAIKAQDFASGNGYPLQGTEEVPSSYDLEPLRLAQSKEAENLGRRLRSNLFGVFFVPLIQTNLSTLSRTIKALEKFTEANHFSRYEVYNNDYESFQATLKEWVQTLKLLLEIHELIEGQGNLTSKNAFLDQQPIESREEARETINEGSRSLSRWHGKEHIAQEVAQMLYTLIWPKSWLSSDTMEDVVWEFAKKWGAWFQ